MKGFLITVILNRMQALLRSVNNPCLAVKIKIQRGFLLKISVRPIKIKR